jgi:hypothetical protein
VPLGASWFGILARAVTELNAQVSDKSDRS